MGLLSVTGFAATRRWTRRRTYRLKGDGNKAFVGLIITLNDMLV